MADKQLEQMTIGGGCFWCIEAVYQDLRGVEKVVSGYAGGHVPNPTYQQICGKKTGHAEVVQIDFDPSIISFDELLYIFWRLHDPTTPNRQGADVGPQYRSIILYHDAAQKEAAARSLQETDASDLWRNPIVTEIEPLEIFYPAEGYHQNYYKDNGNQPYCRFVIDPKIRKMRQSFGDKLKTAV